MAHETYCSRINLHTDQKASISRLERFAALVAAEERKECADMVLTLTCMGNAKECFEVAATYIRARGRSEIS
jgi:hypothetical protein